MRVSIKNVKQIANLKSEEIMDETVNLIIKCKHIEIDSFNSEMIQLYCSDISINEFKYIINKMYKCIGESRLETIVETIINKNREPFLDNIPF